MIAFPAGARIWLVAGVTDMRCSFNGLAAKVQNTLRADPFGGHLFIFRGRRGDMLKILWADADGLCLFTKRLERGGALSGRSAAMAGCTSRRLSWPCCWKALTGSIRSG